MQTKLDNYFKITLNHSENLKKCFIYDPDNYKAFFDNKPDIYDVFLSTRSGIKLYYRQPKIKKHILIPKIETIANVPLLKSNLQKAVRRCLVDEALGSTIALIQKDPLELLRRLPIIYIEDVCLMNSYPIVVWLMMAEKEHKLDLNDINILLNIVKGLCETNTYYNDNDSYSSDKETFELSHNNLQKHDEKDCLLSLYYRAQYGGMKGDMLMLKNSIYYYSENPFEIKNTVYNSIDYTKINSNLNIIPQAIDFHPFPQMINILVKQTNFDNNDIKMMIWFIESGLNIRKNETIKNSIEYKKKDYWKKIKNILPNVRCNLIRMMY